MTRVAFGRDCTEGLLQPLRAWQNHKSIGLERCFDYSCLPFTAFYTFVCTFRCAGAPRGVEANMVRIASKRNLSAPHVPCAKNAELDSVLVAPRCSATTLCNSITTFSTKWTRRHGCQALVLPCIELGSAHVKSQQSICGSPGPVFSFREAPRESLLGVGNTAL